MLKKLHIEPTTKWNLNCRMCFRHTWFDEPICDLSLEDYRHVLEMMPKSVETIFSAVWVNPCSIRIFWK